MIDLPYYQIHVVLTSFVVCILSCSFYDVFSLRRTVDPSEEHSHRTENGLHMWILEAKNVAPKKRSASDVDLSLRPIARLLNNLGVRNWRFNQMKFAPIVLVRSFWSHCPIAVLNLSVTMKNYPRSYDPVWHVRLQTITLIIIFHPTQVLPLDDFTFHFSFATLPSNDRLGNGMPALD